MAFFYRRKIQYWFRWNVKNALPANGYCFPIVFGAVYGNTYKKSNSFYALMLLMQAGLMGVFMATDCLLFYFFWK
jgi:NADH:ubiquinone oxidoreductase subunit 4 (subunit M)